MPEAVATLDASDIPSFTEFMQPTIDVLREGGGSTTIEQLLAVVPTKMGLSPDRISRLHDPESGRQTEVGYRMAWARTYLKRASLIVNTDRGVWALTAAGKAVGQVDARAIAREVRQRAASDENLAPESATATYLFAWNPERFSWPELDQQIHAVREAGVADDTWSCGTVRYIPPGSRFFLIRLGSEPRGIVGSGITTDEVREAPHWDVERAGETARRVDIKFDALSRTPLIRRSELRDGRFGTFNWDTQMSGIRIPDEIAKQLEHEWR